MLEWLSPHDQPPSLLQSKIWQSNHVAHLKYVEFLFKFFLKLENQNYCLQNHIRATRSAPVIFGNPAHSLLLSPSHIISVSNVVVRSLSRLTLQPHGVQHTRVPCPISNRCRHMIQEPESHLETYLECVLEKVWVSFFFFNFVVFVLAFWLLQCKKWLQKKIGTHEV